jgi:polyhydroxyalkanoate synthase
MKNKIMKNSTADKTARETETGGSESTYNPFDPFGLSQAMVDLTQSWTGTPEQLLQNHLNSMGSYMSLWQDSMSRFMGKSGAEEGDNKPTDRRFKHEAWESNPFFDFIKQSYLMGADAILKTVSNIEGLDEKAAHKLEFYTRQFVDAMSPSNFALTNPEVLEHALQTQGQNLVKGFQNFCKDFDPSTGQLQISMADKEAFKLGVNIATTPGQVIYQNDLMQLIQYTPSTETVYKTPLLIVPPWINKYYVLDLQPKNSMIKWLVAQGYTVFVISWINPDENHSEIDFEDYIFDGLITAMDAIEEATGEHEINAVGYCIGGTLLAAALSYLKSKKDERIKSATFFVTMIDFADPGDLGVYIDEQQVKALENKMNEQGYHEGKDMAMSFNMLRSNDLIWSFYVNNYLLGKEPLPFDLLYWNSDSTRMPAKMHSTYLRKMYLENSFKDKGGISVGDVPIDVSSIDTPAYFISTEDDHIAPWISTYAGARLFSGPVRFVLGKSGHIAGIVNHPDSGKYGYYTGGDVDVPAEQWYENVESFEGSWWPDWHKWLKAASGNKVPARQPGGDKLKAIEEAPGSYVKMKL